MTFIVSRQHITALEPKRAPRGRDLHIAHFHHKPPKPGFLVKVRYAPVSNRPVPHSTLNQHPITMIHFMLHDLRREVTKLLCMWFEVLIQVVQFDFLVTGRFTLTF